MRFTTRFCDRLKVQIPIKILSIFRILPKTVTPSKASGSLEEGDGFIELRNANWEPVAEVVDPSSFKTFAQISGDYTELDTTGRKLQVTFPVVLLIPLRQQSSSLQMAETSS